MLNWKLGSKCGKGKMKPVDIEVSREANIAIRRKCGTSIIPVLSLVAGYEQGYCPICGAQLFDTKRARHTEFLMMSEPTDDGTVTLHCGICLNLAGYAHHPIKVKEIAWPMMFGAEACREMREHLTPYNPDAIVNKEHQKYETMVSERNSTIGRLNKQIDDLNVKISGLIDGRKMCEERCEKIHTDDMNTIRKLHKRIRYLEDVLLDNSVPFDMEA